MKTGLILTGSPSPDNHCCLDAFRRIALWSFALALLLVAGITAQAQPGTVDLTFDSGSGLDNAVRSVAVQADGKVLIEIGRASCRERV